MKLCKDCKWVRDPGEFAKCASPKAYPGGCLRTGFEKGPIIDYCEIQREAGWLWARISPEGRCGKSGRWFERDEPQHSERKT